MFAKLTRVKEKVWMSLLSSMGVNPYTEGTVGSYLWKERRNRPLSEKEMSFRETLIEGPNPLSRYLEGERSMAVASAWFVLVGELISDLPHPLQERFRKLPVQQARKEAAEILLLANYTRGKRTATLTNRAWIMSMAALFVSVLTLSMSTFTMYVSVIEKA